MPPIPELPDRGPRSRDELLSFVYTRGRALRRRRTAAWMLGLGLVLTLVVATSAVALRDDDRVDVITTPGVTTTTRSTTTSTTASTAPSTTASTAPSTTAGPLPQPGPAGSLPSVAVALDDTNHLVVLDTTDGHVLRTLDTPGIAPNDNTYADLSSD